jgi:hypothetical protein
MSHFNWNISFQRRAHALNTLYNATGPKFSNTNEAFTFSQKIIALKIKMIDYAHHWLNKYIYMYTVCIRWGGYRVLGLRQINTCRKVPLQVNFLDDDILHCLLWVLSFYALWTRLSLSFSQSLPLSIPLSEWAWQEATIWQQLTWQPHIPTSV